MIQVRRAAFALALSIATILPAHAQSGAKLVLEDFFSGRFVADGVFTNTRDGTQRHVKVKMAGRTRGAVTTLFEDFTFDDGEKMQKTWVFTKTGPGRYTGTREDVIGTADVYEDGNGIRLKYTTKLPTKDGSVYTIGFSDLLARTGPRTVLNTADLSFLFFTVGTVRLTIRKVGGR